MKKFTAILLVIVILTFLFSACGKGDKHEDSSSNSDKTGTQASNQNGGNDESENQSSDNNVSNGNQSTNNSNNNNDNTAVSKPEEKSNFELICEAIKENDNYLVIGALMYEDIYLSVSNNKIIISVSADQSIQHGILAHEHNDTSVQFKVTVNSDGSCEGSCILIYKEIRVIDHTTKTTKLKRSTAIFDAKITDIGDASNYRDYKIYYDNDNSFTKDLSGSVSYYDDYLSLCKEHYAEGILQLALESFYSIINE